MSPLAPVLEFNTEYEALEKAATPDNPHQCRRLGCTSEGHDTPVGVVLCEEHAERLKPPSLKNPSSVKERDAVIRHQIEDLMFNATQQKDYEPPTPVQRVFKHRGVWHLQEGFLVRPCDSWATAMSLVRKDKAA